MGEVAERVEPLNGRLDRWVHSLSDLKPSSFNTKLAAAHACSIGLATGGRTPRPGPDRSPVATNADASRTQ